MQTEGSYLFEPAGLIHTFESKEGAEGFMVVQGANINFNDDDTLMFIMDAGWIAQTLNAIATAAGKKEPATSWQARERTSPSNNRPRLDYALHRLSGGKR